MKIKFNNKYVRWGLTAFLVVVSCIGFYYLLFHGNKITEALGKLVSILAPVVVGMAIAYLLCPVLNYIEKKLLIPLCNKCGWKDSPKRFKFIRLVGIILTAFLFVSLLYMLFYMLISQIVPSVQNIISNFDVYVDNFTSWVNKLLANNPEKSDYIIKTVDKYSVELEAWVRGLLPNSAELIKKVSLSIIGVFGFLWNFVIGFIISIYVLASKEIFSSQAKKAAYAFFEKDTANHILNSFRFTHNTFIGFIGGKIIDSIIIGLLCFIGTTLLQTPYAALVSVIIGVTNIIPFFGPYLGAIPSVILIFIVDPIHPLNCLYFAIFVLILQQFDGNILGPKILGSSTGLTGFWVIFSITLFGGMFGFLGMIVGVPIFAVIYAAIRSVMHSKLNAKGLPIASKLYVDVDYMDEEGIHYLEKEIEEPKKVNDKGSDKKDLKEEK